MCGGDARCAGRPPKRHSQTTNNTATATDGLIHGRSHHRVRLVPTHVEWMERDRTGGA